MIRACRRLQDCAAAAAPRSDSRLCRHDRVAKANSQVDYEKLEYCIRNDLNYRAPRRMCVLDPLKVVISNFPEGQREEVAAADFPPDVNKPGTRPLSFRVRFTSSAATSRNIPQGIPPSVAGSGSAAPVFVYYTLRRCNKGRFRTSSAALQLRSTEPQRSVFTAGQRQHSLGGQSVGKAVRSATL